MWLKFNIMLLSNIRLYVCVFSNSIVWMFPKMAYKKEIVFKDLMEKARNLIIRDKNNFFSY